MSDIFISYSSADRSRVRPLVDALTRRGWSVWWDRTILPGKNWDKVIEDEIASARCVIVLWSRNSIESDWVRTEAEEGKRRGILVPALIDDVAMPLSYKRIQTANLVGWEQSKANPEFDELLLAVTTILGASPVTEVTKSAAVPPPVRSPFRLRRAWMILAGLLLCAAGLTWYVASHMQSATSSSAPVPLVAAGEPVDWWFVYKFNTAGFEDCGGDIQRVCPFGGTVQPYKDSGQQFVFASSADGVLRKGRGCIGNSNKDPLGATFDQVYHGTPFYVLWNDQFYGDPLQSASSPFGHSKGLLAWDGDGNGFVMQVSTPSWPASGSSQHPRKTDGNTLGCIKDNDVMASQHFFALRLTRADVPLVLRAMVNANVVTDPEQAQLVHNGGPPEIQSLVKTLGSSIISKQATKVKLSAGVTLISNTTVLETNILV